MVSVEVAKIGIAGIIGGLFSHWVIRVEKQFIPLYKKFNMNKTFMSGLATLTDLIIALLMILLIVLLIN